MSSTLVLVPTSASSTLSGVAWSSTAQAILTNNGSPATVSLGVSAFSQNLDGSGTGAGPIPSGSVINGIQLNGRVWANNTGTTINSVFGTIGSTSSSGDLSGTTISTSTGASWSIGSSTTFPTGMSGATYSDVNAGNFVIGIIVNGPGSGGSVTISANALSMTIWYTPNNPASRPSCIVMQAAFVERD